MSAEKPINTIPEPKEEKQSSTPNFEVDPRTGLGTR